MPPFRNIRLVGPWLRGAFNDGRTRLFGKFAEPNAPAVHFEWTPHWNDTARLLVEAVEVERLNEPDPGPGRIRHRFLQQFADVCREIIVNYADFESCERVRGQIVKIYKVDSPERLMISIDRGDGDGHYGGDPFQVGSYDLDMPLTAAQIRWLVMDGSTFNCLLWNNRIVDISGMKTDEEIASSRRRW
jgi:hypothetical protein